MSFKNEEEFREFSLELKEDMLILKEKLENYLQKKKEEGMEETDVVTDKEGLRLYEAYLRKMEQFQYVMQEMKKYK